MLKYLICILFLVRSIHVFVAGKIIEAEERLRGRLEYWLCRGTTNLFCCTAGDENVPSDVRFTLLKRKETEDRQVLWVWTP